VIAWLLLFHISFHERSFVSGSSIAPEGVMDIEIQAGT